MTGPGSMGDRIERSDRRRKGPSGEAEITFAVRGVLFQIFDHAGGCAYGIPVDAGTIRHLNKSVDGLRGGDDLRQQVSAARIICIRHHGRTDVWSEAFLLGQPVILMEKVQRLLRVQVLDDLWKGLRGNAYCLD